MDNIFEYASRKQLRFQVAKGNLNTEDLWDLSLESLDLIAKAINKKLKESDEESFINKKTTANTELNVQFEIVKHIIDVKLAEADRKKLAKDRAAKRAQLLDFIGKKELTALESKSLDDLRAELAQLEEEEV